VKRINSPIYSGAHRWRINDKPVGLASGDTTAARSVLILESVDRFRGESLTQDTRNNGVLEPRAGVEPAT
jgi:hypothetical protein